jgi:hypothetical protein
LHIWPDTERDYAEPRWPVHTHRWTISSVIVAGQVLNETFAVEPTDGGQHQLYEVLYAGDGITERARTKQRVSMRPARSDSWRAGDRYEIDLGTFHSTTVPDGILSATLIVSGVQTDAPPKVVGDVSGVDAYRYTARPVADNVWAAVPTAFERRA